MTTLICQMKLLYSCTENENAVLKQYFKKACYLSPVLIHFGAFG